MAQRGTTPQGLEFKSLRETLDDAVPADVAPIGIMVGGQTPSGDFDMAIYKGIVAGALAACSARQVAFVSSEDMDYDLMDWDFENEQKLLHSEFRIHEQLNAVFVHSFPQQVAVCFRDFVRPDEKADIDLSTDSYSFEVYVRTYVWPPNDLGIRMLVTAHIAADGGPPTDFYFVKDDD